MSRKRKWLLAAALVAATIVAGLSIAGYIIANRFADRFDPYIREQTIQYLERRFDSDVELASLRVRVPSLSLIDLAAYRGRGAIAHVEGEGVSLRQKGRPDAPPIFVMKSFNFDVDLGRLFDAPKIIPRVVIDGMQINIPPKGQRPKLNSQADEDDAEKEETVVIIEEVFITNSALTIFPRNKEKVPLQFDIHRVRLESAAKDVAMTYDATLTNAKPPGEIQSKGTFGPWAAVEPGDTPLTGEYIFDKADLGVFKGIDGTLNSTGKFQGTLSSINVEGEARVPNFRLKKGKAVPLSTRFKVQVDGTDGDTILKPVVGTLGSTSFTTSGFVVKREAEDHRRISLNVVMPKGNLRDVLTLAMKETPFMEGTLFLKTKIDIPPLTGRVAEKLILDGQFEVTQAKFLRSNIQEQIDTLSRRGQGKPKSEDILEVKSGMAGTFKLANEEITFSSLSFDVPGAGVDLAGSYNLDHDVMDFHGTLRLQAKVSQTMSGWKRWALKPVDPFFSKQGAGTLLKIQVVGSSKEPKFGRDKSGK